MDLVFAITVLILALMTPSRGRHLEDYTEPDPSVDEHVTNHHHHHHHHEPPAATVELTQAEVPAEDSLETDASVAYQSSERYGFLPTPNVATPILNPLVFPTTFPENHQSDPDLFKSNRNQIRSKHHRKIKINDDGTLWTKLPNMKHLVEIVPIKHKSKGKALAYIVPKSHSVKKKLKKQKRISGIVLDREMPDLSDFGSSDEFLSPESFDSKSSVSESDSTESNSSDYDSSTSSEDRTNIAVLKNVPEKSDNDYDSASENHINDKLNDVVSYFKRHKDVNFDNIIHDVLPDDAVTPEYHVHYIIHKKHPSNKNHSSNKDHSYNNKLHANHVEDNETDHKENHVSHNQSYDHPQSDDHKVEHHHHHSKKDAESSDEKTIRPLQKPNENELVSHHNSKHQNHDLNQDASNSAHDSEDDSHHSLSLESLKYNTEVSNENVPLESIETHNLIHEGSVESEAELKQLYEFLSEIEKEKETLGSHGLLKYHETSASHETQDSLKHKKSTSHENHLESNLNHETQHHEAFINYGENSNEHHVHSNSHSNEHSDQSGDSDESSSEYYSESEADENLNDKSLTDTNFSDLIAKDSGYSLSDEELNRALLNEPISTSDSEESFESISYQAGSAETHEIDYPNPVDIKTDPDQSTSEHESKYFSHSDEINSKERTSNESLDWNSNEIDNEHAVKDLPDHEFIYPKCLKLKKKKTNKCSHDCGEHKSYKLTFLFSR